MISRLGLTGILCGITISLASAQTTRPSIAERERFICSERVRTEDGGFSGRIWQLRWCDPAGGEKVAPQGFGVQAPGEFLRCSLLDSRGRRLLTLRSVGEDIHGAKPIQLVAAEPGAPARAFEELAVKGMWPAALSPDGARIVFFDYRTETVVLGDATSVHRISTGVVTNPFRWSPDSKQVAFYYAQSYGEDDVHIQEHGVAVLSADGRLRELVKASDAVGTPDGYSKYLGPAWGNSGRFIYYSAGLPAGDQRAVLCRGMPSPAVTYRLSIDTGETEEIALGEFASVSPDETFILLYPSPRPTGATAPIGTTKVDVKSREATFLNGLAFPRISPSGKLVAAIAHDGIQFFTTEDWKPHGKAIATPGIRLQDWGADYRWIVIE
ncbi:MAG: hypothetical protein GXY55_09150 [Phycisphaerae bacterium]|nr:hypothetical protein [Phycisphaerae bacterium]